MGRRSVASYKETLAKGEKQARRGQINERQSQGNSGQGQEVSKAWVDNPGKS